MSARSAHAQLRRALDRGNLASALAAARDLPVVSLADALELTLLAAEKDDELFAHLAARWAARYAVEARASLGELALVVAALSALARAEGGPGLAAIAELASRRRLGDVARVAASRADPSRPRGAPDRPRASG